MLFLNFLSLMVTCWAVTSSSSNYTKIKGLIKSFAALYDYKVVECPKNAEAIVWFGQSNSANHIDKKFDKDIPEGLLQYDWNKRKCYRYREPLASSSGSGGNLITDFSVSYMETMQVSELVVAAIGQSGTSVGQWVQGPLRIRYLSALNGLKQAGLDVKYVLWHQGEADARRFGHARGDEEINSIDGNIYFILVDSLRKEATARYPSVRFGISQATYCKGITSQEIRNEQYRLSQSKNSFLLADTDKFTGNRMRYDDCHFTRHAAKVISEEMIKNIEAVISQ